MSLAYRDECSLGSVSLLSRIEKGRPALPFPFFFTHTVPAGFPSPADDYVEGTLDLNELLIHRRHVTVFVTVNDNAMTKYGIHEGDLLIVDRSLVPSHGKMVLLNYQGQEYIRKYYCKERTCLLVAHEREKQPDVIEFTPEREIEIIGVVKAVIHSFKV